MRPAPLSLLCALVAPAARVSAGACGGTPGLRLNHAQVLATHNSYHLATPLFNYSHPPLDVQLERGVRGFELDLFYDNSTKEFRVMHEPGADELSTCADLAACLGVVRAWSDAHPLHFPLFLQLEVLGGLAYAQGACLSSDVEAVRLCAIAHCEGQAPASIALCIALSCSAEVAQVLAQRPACASLATCLAGAIETTTTVDADAITEGIGACTSQSLLTRTPLGEDEAEAAARLVAVLDSYFPAARRVQPSSVLGGRQEAELLGSYAHAGEANFWPEVDCSRGRALFAVSFLGASDAYFAVGSTTGLVRVLNDPADGQPAVAAGALVRTRVDEGPAANATRQEIALASGLHVLSTDVPPPVGPASWEAFAASDPLAPGYFVLPGGLPVRCNPVTTAGGTSCSAAQLEPADLAAPAEPVTDTATTGAPPGGTTTETPPASETPTTSATSTHPSTTTETPTATATDTAATQTTAEALPTASATSTRPNTTTEAPTAATDTLTTATADVPSSTTAAPEDSTAGSPFRPFRLLAVVAGLFAAQ